MCTAVNHLHRRAVRFDLRIPEDEDSEDFVYQATGNKHLLPEYMQVGGSFDEFCALASCLVSKHAYGCECGCGRVDGI